MVNRLRGIGALNVERRWLLVAMLAATLGCNTAPVKKPIDTTGFDEFRIEFLDASGGILTSGVVQFPPLLETAAKDVIVDNESSEAEESAESWQEVRGLWNVPDVYKVKPAYYPAITDNAGPYILKIMYSPAGSLWIDMGNGEDDNVYLSGKMTDTGFSGDWTYCSQGGPQTKGTFIATKTNSKSQPTADRHR